MGLLVNGKWVDEWYDTAATGGRFMRTRAQFRNWITADGSPGPMGEGGYRAEAGRYHLYASLACPWAHRTLIFRALKGLERMIDVSIVNPYMGEHGWIFEEAPGVIPDAIHCPAHIAPQAPPPTPQFSTSAEWTSNLLYTGKSDLDPVLCMIASTRSARK